ncbi:hypothetical protein [Mameliella alba]|uniref:hypothetical protein n=1 Tax=Mameliella alba TaxID=561184 RepID=UPI001055D930|nr:hypothetical protein [Mameliella alba]
MSERKWTPDCIVGLSTFNGDVWHSAAGSHENGDWNTVAVFKHRADADLFAAAPDLYEALDRVTAKFGNDWAEWTEARAALAKAEGRKSDE